MKHVVWYKVDGYTFICEFCGNDNIFDIKEKDTKFEQLDTNTFVFDCEKCQKQNKIKLTVYKEEIVDV